MLLSGLFFAMNGSCGIVRFAGFGGHMDVSEMRGPFLGSLL